MNTENLCLAFIGYEKASTSDETVAILNVIQLQSTEETLYNSQ